MPAPNIPSRVAITMVASKPMTDPSEGAPMIERYPIRRRPQAGREQKKNLKNPEQNAYITADDESIHAC
jgi:hypothetical protein